MKTIVLQVDPAAPDGASLRDAAQVLASGGLVAFPTETVYGLGADALNAEAAARIFQAKGRPAANPLIVHVVDAEAAGQAAVWNNVADQLAARFWPGPLTLVLPRRPAIPPVVTAGGETVAVRAPAHPVAQALLRVFGRPVAAPSANRSGFVSPTRPEHVLKGLEGRIELLIDAGACPGGIESTVLDLVSSPPRILRPGPITRDQLCALLGEVTHLASTPGEGILRSPGMMARHYAPRASMELVSNSGERVKELRLAGVRVGWMPLGSEAPTFSHDVVVIPMPDDPREYAAGLYDALHRLDDLGVERIVVEAPPESERWRAVRDRLQRASHE